MAFLLPETGKPLKDRGGVHPISGGCAKRGVQNTGQKRTPVFVGVPISYIFIANKQRFLH